MARVADLIRAILNDETIDFVPKTKNQAYLKACCERCGCQGLPEPTTVNGALLYQLAEKMAGGGDITVESLTATENGTYTAEEGKAYSPVVVNVPQEEPVLEELSVTENGTYLPSEGKDGFSKAVVNVPNPSSGSLSITENGTYDVTEKASAVVNVQGGGGATEPYIEEMYDSNGNLIDAVMHGYTKIRDDAFYNCSKLALTELPSGITSIGEKAFFGCSKLALTELPSGITSIGENAFYGCSTLALTELPSGITSIGEKAFYNCSKLALTELPSGITSIGKNAFSGCTSLTSITFTSTPTTVNNYAFTSCTKLLDIYVPWAQGEVANAPWGATNATIHYNYTPTT